MELKEVAPPTKKHERMVKHIKKAYAKKGGLSDEEKSIAYATAWKNYNKKESFEINKSEHKKVQKKAKLRNLAKGNMNPNEKAAAEKKAGGPKLIGEKVKGQDTESRKEGAKERSTEKGAHDAWKKGSVGKTKRPLYSTTRHTKGDAENYATQQKQSIKWHDKRTKGKFIPGTTTEGSNWKLFKSAMKSVVKKKEERKPEKAMDAGARAKRKLARKDYAAKVSGSTDIVPDDIRDHKSWKELKLSVV